MTTRGLDHRIAVSVLVLVAGGLLLPNGISGQDRSMTDQGSTEILLGEGDIVWRSVGESGLQIAQLYGDSGAEGRPFVFRLRLPDGFEMAPHTHPVAENMTVLSGRFFVGIGEAFDRDAAVEYGPGSFVRVEAGVPAYMFSVGDAVVQVHGVGPLRTVPVG